MAKKTFSVCTSPDMKPFGYTDSLGAAQGFSIDLIERFNAALGEKVGETLALNLVSITPANRMQFRAGGKCDATITSMNITPERRKVINFVEPGYYYSGANILAKKSADITSWEGLKGRKICSLQGSIWNSEYERRYGVEILAFAGIPEAMRAVQDGRCEGWLSDDGYLQTLLGDEIWKEYELKLTTQDGSPWGAAVAFDNDDLKDFLAGQIKQMHADGTKIELVKKWGMNENDHIKEQHAAN